MLGVVLNGEPFNLLHNLEVPFFTTIALIKKINKAVVIMRKAEANVNFIFR